VRYLFDTQIVIWAAHGSARLPKLARELIEDRAAVPVVSVVSLWEVAIKAAKQRNFPVDPYLLRRAMLNLGWEELSVIARHVLAVAHLPLLHHDPFDRLLLAQALEEDMLLVTTDSAIANYTGRVRLV
jgi:PIN domain nuclease of toxin-antitoxin system